MSTFVHITNLLSIMDKDINRIKEVLAEKKRTNKWLAAQMGVTDMTVSRWKTNKIQPSMAQFVEISRLLQVDIKELLEVDFCSEGLNKA